MNAPPLPAAREDDSVKKRSVSLNGHQTSVSLEDAFWTSLQDVAASRGMTLRALIEAVDAGRREASLSSALRLHVLAFYKDLARNEDAR